MNIGKRLIFHALSAMLLVVAVFGCMFAAIMILGDREAGMVLGLFTGLVLGQLGFSYRFLSASLWMRFAFSLAVFLFASIVSVGVASSGIFATGIMYGLWDVVLPYVAATIASWELIYRNQKIFMTRLS